MATKGRRVDIREYLNERQAVSTKGLERSRLVRVLRRLSTHEFRQRAKVKATTLLLPLSRLKARRYIRERQDLRLNLASGPNRLPGWVNVDVVGMHPELHWDLRRGIPFPTNSASAVFLEHFIEHLTYAQTMNMLGECYRVLAPGGRIRVGVPDFGRYIDSYVGDGAFIEQLRPGRPTRLLAVAEVALSHGHRSVWDAETLERVLADAGFGDARARRFGDSDIEPAPDTPMREPESLYVEGRKPS